MTSEKVAAALAVLCVLSVAVPAVVLAQTPDGVNASVTNVTVSPQQPVPGESTTFTATVRNLASSESEYTIDAVALRSPENSPLEEYARIRDLGTLAPGTELTVPLDASFDSPGTKDLRIVVFGENADGERITLQYPVSVRVVDGEPTVDVNVSRAVVDAESTATVTVANGMDRELRNVEVSLDGVPTEQTRRVRSRLAGGETAEFRFTIEPEETGEATVRANVDYELANSGVDGSTSARTRVTVEELNERVTVDGVARRGESAIEVTVTNLGNSRVESVIVGGESGDLGVGRATIAALAPGASRTVMVPVSGLDPGASATASIRAAYDVPGRDGYTGEADGGQVVFDKVPNATPSTPQPPAEIRLTGIEVVEEDGKLRISGSASNVGLTEAQSVIVSVRETEGVTPAEPSREYFVGRVPGSDLVSFDVYARTDGSVDTIPLEVSYLSEGERQTQEFSVPAPNVDRTTVPEPSSGSMVLPAVGGTLVVLAVLVIIFIGWRSRRDDS